MSALSSAPRLRAVPDTLSSRAPEHDEHRGRGTRLIRAIEAVDHFPMLADARERVLTAAARDSAEPLVEAAESDVALALAVLRRANAGRRPKDAIASVRKAVEALGPAGVAELARELPSSDFFQRASRFGTSVDSVRLHAVAVKRIAARLAMVLDRDDRDALVIVALLHDVGKLVLCHAVPEYPDELLHAADTPDARVRAERAALGFDHATVGAVVARRAGLPPRIATAIETHHREGGTGPAAVVRLADMLAHYATGRPVGPRSMLAAAADLGLHTAALREVMYEMPAAGAGA
ncbi:MAG: hypothetical protein QOJ55_2602, partial [Solirubrobacteraceae bacterium]|nr:hypothetical protein [Solirubrobacteraceae bacterium]